MDAEEIRELRKQLGWTGQRFAEEIGVSISTVSRWENGRSKPSRLAVEKMEKIRTEVK